MRLYPIISPYILGAAAIIAVAAALFQFARDRRSMALRIVSLLEIVSITILTLVIGLRPQRQEHNAEVELKNLDVLFVLDTTISMWAEDYNGKHPRMGGALSDIRYIINELDGSNFGLITFDNRSRILAPYTQDVRAISDDLLTIEMPDYLMAEGSNFNEPYRDIESLLVSSDRKENRRTIIFILSDGEITDESDMTDYSPLAGYVDGGAILGYGTSEGGRMTTTYGRKLVDPETYKEAVSHIDEENLQALSEALGVNYINMDRQERLTGLLTRIKNEGSLITENKDGIVMYEDLYYYYVYPLIAVILLLLISFILRQKEGD